MSLNKNASIRYQVLDRCFGNPRRKYFIADLLDECNNKLKEVDLDSSGIQRRQLFDDIKHMESAEGWNAEIDRLAWGKKKYYRYHDPTFSINKLPLNSAEINQVKSAMTVISRFNGMPQFEWISHFSSKLDDGSFSIQGNKPIISFDNNSYLTGIERLSELYFAVLYHKVLSIKYHPFKTPTAQTMVIHPYYLKQYNNRWFVLGLNDNLEKLSTVAIDRIKDISEINLQYIPNTEIDFDEYFEDIIGVTRHDGDVVKIILQFNLYIAPYVTSKPIHGSQKIIRNSTTGLTMSIEVIPNYELEAVLLSFGENVQIISPNSFREAMAIRIKKMYSDL